MQNFAIQLTRPGVSALAVVRLQGPAAYGFVQEHFDRPLAAGRVTYGRWHDGVGGVLDDVLVAEEKLWCDVNLHGGLRIVEKLLEQASTAGFKVVTGDEATEAAAGTDLEAWLPRATTEAGVRALLAQPEAWRNLAAERVDLQRLIADRTLFRLLNPATLAIVGAPNVGKSTLANRLAGQERSIVADLPGTTRDWVGCAAELDGLPVTLVDTPGRRVTEDPVEREAITISETPIAAADLVVLVMDATRSDETLTGFESAVRVANKCDLSPAPPGWLGICASTGEGLPALMHEVHSRLGVDCRDLARARWWTIAQEQLLREQGTEAFAQIAGALPSW